MAGNAEDCLTISGRRAEDESWGELLAAAQQGDVAAYRQFLTSITPFIRSLVRKRDWHSDGVDDVVQDVLLTIHRIRNTYEPGRPVKPWLAAISARRSIDAMRRRGRIGTNEIHDEVAYETFADSQANYQETAGSVRELARMTSGLSPGQKEAVELVKLREMSLVEASAASGQSVALLKVNIHRAIKKMRANLSKDPQG